MLKRSERLSAKEVSDVLRRGRAFHSDACMLRVLPLGGVTRATVVAGSKVSKKANERNYQKRRARHALAEAITQLEPGIGLVLVLKPAIKTKDFGALSEEIARLVRSSKNPRTS